MKQVKRIFIVGHPGAGKGLVAKNVAEKLGWNFVNADFEIEFRMGRLLADIMGDQGKQAFLDSQYDILKELTTQENIVVTTDASVVDSQKINELLKDEFTAYIQVSTPVQIERTLRSHDKLLKASETESFLNTLHEKRDSLYEVIASLVVDSDDNKLEEHVNKIVTLASSDNISSADIKVNKKDKSLFHRQTHSLVELTNQQAVCLKLLAQGKSSKEIARDLDISHRTVEGNLAKVMEILGCISSKELIALYHDQP